MRGVDILTIVCTGSYVLVRGSVCWVISSLTIAEF
jgi:hypothetical protein